MTPTYDDFLIARKKYLAEKANETPRVEPFWNRSLFKIIALDVAILAGFAFLVMFPNLIGGIVIWAFLLAFLAAGLILTLGVPASRKRIAKSFLIGEGITILGRINRGERIL